MNISKALKTKSRIAGNLKKLQDIATSKNCTREGQNSSIDFNEVWEDLKEARVELIVLKSAIARATFPIVGKLVELAELKAEVEFYNDLSINEGTGNVRGSDGNYIEVSYKNHVSEKDKNDAVKALQTKIDALQDEIDSFNASTSVFQ